MFVSTGKYIVRVMCILIGILLGLMISLAKELYSKKENTIHAHWIDKDKDCEDWHIHQHECSKCGMGDQHNPNVNVPYCWFCGAKMDEEVKK